MVSIYFHLLHVLAILQLKHVFGYPKWLSVLILFLIEMPFNTFANIAYQDQADIYKLPDQGLLCLLLEILDIDA